MRLAAALQGNLAKMLEAEVKTGERAAMRAMRQGTMGLQGELRRQVEAAGLGRRTANTWRAKTYPRSGGSFSPAGLVYSKAPGIIAAFDQGAIIRSNRGRYLAIPTGYNRQSGRRRARAERRGGVWANVKVTPADMVAAKGLAFTRPRKDGPGLLWMLSVTRGQIRSAKSGRISDRAFAGGFHLIGSGRKKRTQEALAARAVPMFVLLPQVSLRPRLDVKGAAARWQGRLPELLHRAWQEEDSRGDGRR